MSSIKMPRRDSPKASLAPNIVSTPRPTLRILGTEITAIPEIQTRAAADLGIDIEFDCLDFLSAQRRAATQPASYDVYDQCFHNLDIVWYWRAIQPIDVSRITLWDQVSSLTKTGRIAPHAAIGAGDAPVTRLYAQADGSLGNRASRWISMLPTVHNVDSFVYRSDRIGDAPTDTWAALFDPAWSGHVALVDEPAIGVFDALLAAEASGEMEPQSAGQLNVAAIDQLIGLLSRKRDAGHFVGFWKTALEAADWMSGGEAWMQSAWSPAITNLQRRGISVVQAVPREGYRAWHGGLCLSSHLSGYMRDVAYDYLNWWLSGYAGAVVARQGYYMSVLDPVKQYLSPAEWRFWYEGAAASETLSAPDGSPIILPGTIRSGGSYWQRFGSVAIWNTTMDEHNYLARLWARLTSGQRISA